MVMIMEITKKIDPATVCNPGVLTNELSACSKASKSVNPLRPKKKYFHLIHADSFTVRTNDALGRILIFIIVTDLSKSAF